MDVKLNITFIFQLIDSSATHVERGNPLHFTFNLQL